MNESTENTATAMTKINPSTEYKRQTQKIMKGNHAAAEATRLCRCGFIPAYPITPQTTIVEELSAIVARGELDARFINMDSEHSVFAAAMGAAVAGERVFTATSGQGLFYAHEALHAIAHFRLPVVACNVGRPSIPWNIWSDQSDSLSQRDTGWVQFYGESSQEVLDTIIQAFYIAENLNLPVLVVLDAFYQSHTSENVWVPDQDLVDEFLPPKKHGNAQIDTRKYRSFGGLVPPDQYDKFNFLYWQDINRAEQLTMETGAIFGEMFGRKYAAVEAVNINEHTEIVLVALSSISTTIKGVLPAHPDVGLLKIRLFRPFPVKSVNRALQPLAANRKIVCIDRNFLGEREGALMQEMKRTLYGKQFSVVNVFAGVGGRDAPPEVMHKIIQRIRTDEKDVIWIDME